METDSINVRITAEPLRLTMSERKSFKISIVATNQGSEVINPELHRAKLSVNGKESIVWTLAIGNGGRELKWRALPAGETVSMTWSSMGESLFPDPGDFALVLHYKDAELPPTKVQVLAE